MGRLSINDLPKPAKAWRIDRLVEITRPDRPSGGWATPSTRSSRLGTFETKEYAKREDRGRIAGLREAARLHPEEISASAAQGLANRLDRPFSRCEPTLASYRYMRRFRIRLIGALWKLIEDGHWSPAHICKFTAVHRSWEFTPETLHRADPTALLESLRAQLKRLGASHATGPLIAFIHGEYEPNAGIFRLHVHGFAFGDMIAIVDRLRDLPAYRPRLIVTTPIYISRGPLSHLPYPLGYICKGYWPNRWIGPVGEDRVIKRQRRPSRIPEPHHSQVLLWLDRWSIAHLTLLMNVRVGPDGFIQTKTSTNIRMENA